MQFFKNRTVLGVMCIAAALLICFGITPLFNKSLANKAEIVRVVKQIKSGEKITADMVKTVEVGSFNLPENVARNPYAVIGKYAVADFVEGDYILTSKVEVEPAAENAYLYHLDGKKQAISISVKAFANGLSGKLKRDRKNDRNRNACLCRAGNRAFFASESQYIRIYRGAV